MDGDLIDLHLHYLPDVDDGVRSLEEGVALCQGLFELGYRQLVTTPHIRSGLFNNRPAGLEVAYQRFVTHVRGLTSMPTLGLAAEHFFDDIFWNLLKSNEIIPYPGGHALLLEFPDGEFPLGVEQRFFEMRVKGLQPVLAHPERYSPLFRSSRPLGHLQEAGLLAQLDLMALVGRYGRRPQKAAERMLKEGMYFIACTDAHRASDVPQVADALVRLRKLVGDAQAQRLVSTHPMGILTGAFPE